MSYWDVSLVADDRDLHTRVTAASAQENVDPDPAQWSFDHRWQWAAQPGWSDAYASAIAAEVPNPGRDEAVITDGMILAAVQAIAP